MEQTNSIEVLPKVLLVEDFEDTVRIIKRLLARNGFQVDTALTIKEAKERLKKTIPDAIILDINLPDGSGLDLLKDLKSTHEDIPVIMLTAYTELENAIRSLQQGVDDFIPKPFDNAYLVHSVNKAVEKNRLKKRLRQSEKFRVLGELASGVAHDFNNLLHSMNSHLYLLEKKLKQGSDIGDHLAALKTSIEDASEIVKRLSSMGKKRKDELQVIDLSNLVQDTVLMTKPKWFHEPFKNGREIKLLTELEPDLYVRVNPSEIREVLTNLIFNAVDAMPTGGTIKIRTQKVGQRAVCHVKDTGLGISPEIVDKIFDPFFSTKGHSSGLGLSISYAIIQRHGGEMNVHSKPGQGTVFTISLPRIEMGNLV